MTEDATKAIALIESLNERAKELNCLYKTEESLKDFDSDLKDVFRGILEAIPPGWQFPDVCTALININGDEYKLNEFEDEKLRKMGLSQKSGIVSNNNSIGFIEVFYTGQVRLTDGQPYLKEEQKLLDSIADRIGNYMFNRNIYNTFGQWDEANEVIRSLNEDKAAMTKLIKNTDPKVLREYLQSPSPQVHSLEELEKILSPKSDKHWKWRMDIARLIGEKLDHRKFGVEALYLIGSVKNAESGPGSDIDLLLHFRGDDKQKAGLLSWLEGWGLCLAEMNYQKTEYRTGSLLDIHLVTDEDIKNNTSFAAKIGAVTDGARLIKKWE